MTSQDTQQQQRALLDNIPDMAWLKDRDCRYLAVNTAYLEILGMPERLVLGKRPDEIWPAEIAEVYLRTDRAVLKSGRRRRYEETRPDPSGTPRWFETIKSPIRDQAGRIVGTVGISRDISERKAAESELIKSRTQLRELSNYLQSVREAERARISRELHDELGQTLTALKMELGWLKERLPSEPTLLRTRVDRLVQIVDHSVADLQRIAADLRPMILDELGLVSAIQWLTQNLSERSPLAIELSLDRTDVAYSKDVSTAAFRIVQEALTNIVRHSGATSARIVARHSANELQLDISDDGRGMDVTPSKRERLGLIGMSERAHMLGGSMEIDSAPGRGTRISVRLPLSIDKPATAPSP
ncbi:PAS domain-containing protein [Bradyrhizobium lablabi]|uniref:PAS domain-containing sensor histidine kinase n=1 Tax=Bradyrhizobium lablabi TaxID=722472 RepID=UPI001BA93E29|nr:PAS domain-containing protein [Bradyrhizobium lablabi]MBR0696693.1 PAS domain-containing protein [Bradyrhizobium lablabi]